MIESAMVLFFARTSYQSDIGNWLALLPAELDKSEVIHDKQIDAGQLVEELGYARLYPCYVYGLTQLLHIVVVDLVAAHASLPSERSGEIALANSPSQPL